MTDQALSDVGDTWERLAQLDPLWAVLSEPERQGRRWDVDEFLGTGEREIVDVLAELRVLGLDRWGSALDFGCGVGRLSQPLGRRFERVVGVDIAPTMVATARDLARELPSVSFVVNDRPDLSLFDDAQFDLVYSNIVLQHMPPEIAESYLAEFFRVVAPSGFVVFQIPSHLTDEWLPDSNDGTQLAAGLHRADLEVLAAAEPMTVGADSTVVVRVRNVSDGAWLQDLTNQINLGNHWLSLDGDMVVPNDGRARIPGRVAPGSAFDVELSVRAPTAPGRYMLEIDLVQEGVTWFATQGSTPLRREVTVAVPPAHGDVQGPRGGPDDLGPVAPQDAAPDVREYPTFMMRGVRRERVEQLVQEFGAEVLAVHGHTEQWVSYRYVTRRFGTV